MKYLIIRAGIRDTVIGVASLLTHRISLEGYTFPSPSFFFFFFFLLLFNQLIARSLIAMVISSPSWLTYYPTQELSDKEIPYMPAQNHAYA